MNHISKWMLPEDNPYDGGKTIPMTEFTEKLLCDLMKALEDCGWDPDDEYEVQIAGTWKKDKFLCIKNRSKEEK